MSPWKKEKSIVRDTRFYKTPIDNSDICRAMDTRPIAVIWLQPQIASVNVRQIVRAETIALQILLVKTRSNVFVRNFTFCCNQHCSVYYVYYQRCAASKWCGVNLVQKLHFYFCFNMMKAQRRCALSDRFAQFRFTGFPMKINSVKSQ